MTSSSDDLEKVLQQNLKLRRELGTEIAKASNSSAKQMAEAPATPRNQPPKLTTSEARQGTGPRAMFWVLIGSLAVIAGLALGFAFGLIALPWGSIASN